MFKIESYVCKVCKCRQISYLNILTIRYAFLINVKHMHLSEYKRVTT